MGDLTPGLFTLKASSGDFNKSTALYFNAQRVSLFIQTNRPVYRPNDRIEFRVFALDSRTKPYEILDASKIWILDPGNSRVKLWKNPTFVKGLYESHWMLSDAEAGTWKILVEADGEVINFIPHLYNHLFKFNLN